MIFIIILKGNILCNNTLLGQRLNLSSSSDIFDNLIKKMSGKL